MNYSVSDICRIVATVVIWGVVITVGLTVFVTIAGAVIAFASTGIGAIVLAIIGWKIYKSLTKETSE